MTLTSTVTGRAAARGRKVGSGTVLIAAAIALGVAWPWIAPGDYFLTIGVLVALNLIGATSLHLVIRTGHVSLAHAGLMGLGAYATALAATLLHWSFIPCLLLGMATPALLSAAIGPILLRLTGKYFVLVTFLLGEILRLSFISWASVTGGANGLFDLPAALPDHDTPLAFYYLVLAFSIGCVLLVARVLASELGRAIDSVRDAEQVAQCSGVPVLRLKTGVFVLGSALVGVQGGLQAYYLRYVDPSGFTSVQSIEFVTMNVIGGMEHVVGAVFGAVFMVALPQLLSGYVNLQQILFGLILVVVMAAFSGGAVGAWRWIERQRR